MLFREGMSRLLAEFGHEVVEAVADADALRCAVENHEPDLAIIDVRMPPDMDAAGAAAALELRERFPELGLLLLSQHIELRHCRTLIGTPGFGYLLKDRVLDLDEIGDSIDRVVRGGTALDPEVVRVLVHAAPAAKLERLTDREREVLGLVAQGRSNTSIAASLHISERTVEGHLRSVFNRLGLPDDGATHRRVLAVVAYLEGTRQ